MGIVGENISYLEAVILDIIGYNPVMSFRFKEICTELKVTDAVLFMKFVFNVAKFPVDVSLFTPYVL